MLTCFVVFSLVSCVAAVHGIRAAMASLKKTGTDFTSAKGMDPKAFFEVMGTLFFHPTQQLQSLLIFFRQASTTSSDSMPRQVARRSRSSE